MTDPGESRLNQAIGPVLEAIAARPLSRDEQAMLEEILTDHGQEGLSPPAWMVDLFETILARKAGQSDFEVPSGYPFGVSGLSNILHDIKIQFLDLGVDDQGEALSWAIPACGVTLFISRENSTPGYDRLEILPYPERLPDPSLLQAILQQNMDLARQLLVAGANPQMSYRNQASPLVLALYYAPELVPDLLFYGADPNEVGVCGTPLMLAASRSDASSVEALLAQGAQANQKLEKPVRSLRCDTALACALACDESPEMLATLEKLLQAGASIRQEKLSETEVLNWMANESKVQAVKVLLLHGADTSGLSAGVIAQIKQAKDPDAV